MWRRLQRHGSEKYEWSLSFFIRPRILGILENIPGDICKVILKCITCGGLGYVRELFFVRFIK